MTLRETPRLGVLRSTAYVVVAVAQLAWFALLLYFASGAWQVSMASMVGLVSFASLSLIAHVVIGWRTKARMANQAVGLVDSDDSLSTRLRFRAKVSKRVALHGLFLAIVGIQPFHQLRESAPLDGIQFLAGLMVALFVPVLLFLYLARRRLRRLDLFVQMVQTAFVVAFLAFVASYLSALSDRPTAALVLARVGWVMLLLPLLLRQIYFSLSLLAGRRLFRRRAR